MNYWGLIRIPVHYQIIEHEPNRQLAMKGRMGPIDFRDGYLLKGRQRHRDPILAGAAPGGMGKASFALHGPDRKDPCLGDFEELEERIREMGDRFGKKITSLAMT